MNSALGAATGYGRNDRRSCFNLPANAPVLKAKMKSQNVKQFLEDAGNRDRKLQEVFNKMTGMWQQPSEMQNKLTSDVIETVLPDSKHIPIAAGGYTPTEEDGDSMVSEALARRLENELRAAKSAQLACGEVLLPCDLLPRVARDILRMAESEPCGLRGCTLYLSFEAPEVRTHIGTIVCDPNTVSTFELYLTLKQDASSWHSLLPQFIKNLTRGGTIVVSPGFMLEKKKLYRSYQER